MNQSKNEDQQPNYDLTTMITKAADFFTKIHTRKSNELDFSIKSLEVVDELLGEALDFIDAADKEHIEITINTAGSYIFEIARRNFGGKYFWYDRLNQPILVTGQPEFEVSICAFDKAKKRMENGSADNIPFYFAGYVDRVTKKQSAMIL